MEPLKMFVILGVCVVGIFLTDARIFKVGALIIIAIPVLGGIFDLLTSPFGKKK
jgi:hypothetical protein